MFPGELVILIAVSPAGDTYRVRRRNTGPGPANRVVRHPLGTILSTGPVSRLALAANAWPSSAVSEIPDGFKSRGGFGRLARAVRYSYAGFRDAIRHEAAIRQELAVFAILLPLSALLRVTLLEHLVLVLSMLLVLLVEFLNSAIEMTVDRISLEPHPLAGRAKDLGSAAVFVALVMAGLSWLFIAGPLAVRWLRR